MAEVSDDDRYRLFKFRKIDKRLLESLVHSEIYFAPPDRLNDPFDCKVDIPKALERAISKSPQGVRPTLERLREKISSIEKVQADFANPGVCSFSLELVNTLMWSHYADEHRGVCLMYDFPMSFFENASPEIIGTFRFDYKANSLTDWFIDQAHHFSGTFAEFGVSLIKKILTIKAPAWEYEQEARILRKSAGKYALDKQYLKQVCFGLETPEPDIALVRNLLNRFGYEVTYCKIVRSSGSDFGIDVEEISSRAEFKAAEELKATIRATLPDEAKLEDD